MKRLLLLTILLLSGVFPVMAQDDDVQTAQPLSARYQFEIASDWIFTNESVLFEEDTAFPVSESVLAATSQDVLDLVEDENFELFDSTVDGAFIVTLIFPAVFFEMDGMAPDDIVTEIGESLTSDVDGTVSQETMELRGISGHNFAISMNNGQAGQIALLFDPDDNLLMFMAFGDEEYAADIENALISLTFFQYSEEELLDAENLTTTVEIAPDFAAVDIPAGWWLFKEEGGELVVLTPTVIQAIFDASAMENLLASQSVAIISLSTYKDDLDESAFNEDGTLNLESVVTEVIGEDAIAVTSEEWDGAPGLAGIQFEVEVSEPNLKARGLVLDGDDVLYIVAGISTPDTWDTYSDLIDAILLTIHRVETE
ncbi:MAG: hypothetical protein L0154_01865 [Chloroflexi bacterium]|nr:hypothetical protein [Chloroflexota bacterium]